VATVQGLSGTGSLRNLGLYAERQIGMFSFTGLNK
uniref:Aspartate aminotransferase 2 (Fragments) n=1 Tax=Pseudotsuga menziesii TaxID=3357 RepID=AAT2_PSEMZ|nr:RecName: Full=Aspartate aminotransferase 2; AltName: Full=Transaminase A [Pseudotsuga menziesii]